MIHAIKAWTSSRSSTEEEVIHSAWGEVREGLSDIKASTGFRRPRGICQLDKERNGIPEERAWAKAREHETTWYIGRITWNSVLRALPGHRVQTEQNREQRDTASRWVRATQILVCSATETIRNQRSVRSAIYKSSSDFKVWDQLGEIRSRVIL